MIIVRFKMQCQPGKTEEVVAAAAATIGPTRPLPGVINYDVARDLTDSNALIVTEVYQDREAMERHESLPEVAKVIKLIQGGALTGLPEWTRYEAASSESPTL